MDSFESFWNKLDEECAFQAVATEAQSGFIFIFAPAIERKENASFIVCSSSLINDDRVEAIATLAHSWSLLWRYLRVRALNWHIDIVSGLR